MSDEESQQLADEYNSLVDRYNQLVAENERLEQELRQCIRNVNVLSNNAQIVGNNVHRRVRDLQQYVDAAHMDTGQVLEAINDLSKKYFTFKTLSEAAKMLTKYTSEYNEKFKYYAELRRITLGYVIGIDAHIIDDENSRKKVEKAYLENTEYWLAYCIAAVMLWKSDEPEAANRAVNKALSMNYNSACLFFMLINLRFRRQEAARKWYLSYLDRVDLKNPGKEYRYMLQAYLSGAFGSDPDFEQLADRNFKKLLVQTETINADLGQKFIDESRERAENILHKTKAAFPSLKRYALEGELLENLLSDAEKNQVMVDYYTELAEREQVDISDLNQRIEDVLYTLINSYEDEEFKVYKEIKKNEFIMQSGGDEAAADRRLKKMIGDENEKKSFAEQLYIWAYSENPTQTDEKVRRFSLHHMKKWIMKGVAQFGEIYRRQVPDVLNVTIEGCSMKCDSESKERNTRELETYFEKNKMKNMLEDKQFKIACLVCIAAAACIGISVFTSISAHSFKPGGLVVGLLAGIGGGVFAWFRTKELEKILAEKKRLAVKKLLMVFDEFEEWKKLFAEADAVNDDAQSVFEQF